MPEEKIDVCVIGGGVIGLFTAMSIARAGKTVRLIDKAFSGSSRNNIGEVLLQGHHPDTLDFMRFCADEWQKAADEFGEDLGFEKRGSMLLAFDSTEAEDLEQRASKDTEHGLPSEVVTDMSALKKRFDYMRLAQDIVAAKVSEEDGSIDTQTAMDGLRKLAIQAGVRIWGSDKVEKLLVEDGVMKGVTTDSGETCLAESTILCVGVWAGKLLPEYGIKMPLRPARCHILDVQPSGRMPLPMLAHREKTGGLVAKYLPKTGQALVMYSGLMDQAQATYSTEVDEEAVAWMRQRLGQYMDTLANAELKKSRAVSLAVTPDLLPYIGPVDQIKGLFAALGMNGKSYAYAPGVAAVMAALVQGEEPPVQIDVFSPNRFAG